jgi:hypothetical protein
MESLRFLQGTAHYPPQSPYIREFFLLRITRFWRKVFWGLGENGGADDKGRPYGGF